MEKKDNIQIGNNLFTRVWPNIKELILETFKKPNIVRYEMNPEAIASLQDVKDMLSAFTIGINIDIDRPEVEREAIQRLEEGVKKKLVIKTQQTGR